MLSDSVNPIQSDCPTEADEKPHDAASQHVFM